MGLASGTDSSDTMKLCVFDLQRGQIEGQELDKILFFYPSDFPISMQLSVIGLSEALITFTRIFSPEAACEVIDAEMHSHVFYEAEPDIWMVMVVEKDKESEGIWRIDDLRKVLKEIHSLFAMFHGSVRALVDREPTGGLVRTYLYFFIMDFLSDCFVGKKLRLPNFRDSLKERGTVQMLTVGREAAIEVESLVRVLESSAGTSQCHTLIMFQDLLVSTDLSPIDSVNIFTYAVLRLTPLALSSATSSWSYSRKGSTTCNTTSGAVLANSEQVLDQYRNSRDTSPLGHRSYPVIRPLQHSKWSKGKDGFLATDIWGTEVNSLQPSIPTIFLRQTDAKMYLICHQHRGLTVIILIPVSSVDGERGVAAVKQKILEEASFKMSKVEEKLSRGWGGENAYHVSGYRYLLVDGDNDISRASPPGKVATLSKESLVSFTKFREEIDAEKSRGKLDNLGGEKDLEVCIRAKNNAWLVARVSRGKELYMVLDRASETLLYASEAAETFSQRYCEGAFSFD